MERAPILVIGYGSELRRDDAAGLRVVDEIEWRQFPGVECLTVTQLTPDLAAAIVGRDTVYFIDATRDGTQKKPVCLTPERTSRILNHVGDPEGILSLTAQVYDCAPIAWLIAVPGQEFDVGMGLSARTKRAVTWAVRAFEDIQFGDQCRREADEADHIKPNGIDFTRSEF